MRYNKYVPSCICRCILVGAVGFCAKCLLLYYEGKPNRGSNVSRTVQSMVGTFREEMWLNGANNAHGWPGSAEPKPDCTKSVCFVSFVLQNCKVMNGSRRVNMLTSS
jgi:hypothetical protein